MRFKLIATVVAAAAVFSAPAFAEGFTGPRVEAYAGYDHISGKLKYEDTAFPSDNFTAKKSTDGAIYGVGIGYDMPVGDSWIVGVEGTFDLASNKRCSEVVGGDALCFKAKRNFSAGARIGTKLSKSTLFYVGATYVNGRARVSYDDGAGTVIAASDNRGGWRGSAGIEVALTSKVYAKGEYRYSHYSRYHASAGTQTGSLGFDRHQALAGLGLRF
jgi:outer membrane immunogenic protein